MFSQQELAPAEDQGVVFSIVQAAPNATIEQTKLFARQINDVYKARPETAGTFELTFPNGGFGGMVTKPWSERTKTAQQLQMEVAGPLSQIPGVRAFPTTPPALPGGGDFPVDLVIASPGEPQRLVEIANQLVRKAFASGLFMFADADLKFDQPQAEVVFDRDKLRSQGVDLSQAGRDLSILLGGDYVNRFSIQGRSYKVIPQIERAERLTPDQLSQIYITGSGDKLVPLSTFATLKTTAEPRELKKFQQLNAVRDPGRDSAAGAARHGAGLPRKRSARDSAAGLHDRLRRRVATAADGRRQLPHHVPAVGDADLPRARGAVRELPRSVHRSRRLGAARGLRRVAVLVPRVDDAQHLQPGRPDHARRPGRQERHPDRRVRESPAGDRRRTSWRPSSRPPARACGRS